jgi:hypothetical protein
LVTGNATLRWTISNGCGTSTDDVIITRTAAPTSALAGPDQSVCATTATLAGNTPATGTGMWTVIAGTATITTPTSPTSGITNIGCDRTCRRISHAEMDDNQRKLYTIERRCSHHANQ